MILHSKPYSEKLRSRWPWHFRGSLVVGPKEDKKEEEKEFIKEEEFKV